MNSLRWEKRSWRMGCQVNMFGSADLAAAPALKHLEDLLSKESDIVMDVAALEYADSTFLRFLLRVRSGGNSGKEVSLKLTGVSPRIERMLNVTGLSRLFRYPAAQPT